MTLTRKVGDVFFGANLSSRCTEQGCLVLVKIGLFEMSRWRNGRLKAMYLGLKRVTFWTIASERRRGLQHKTLNRKSQDIS